MRFIQPRSASAVVLACLALAPSRTAGEVVLARVEVAAMRFARLEGVGPGLSLPEPGTYLTLVITRPTARWVGLDFEASKITKVVDGRDHSLLVPNLDSDLTEGVQSNGSLVSDDGETAVLTVWGRGLPHRAAQEIHIAGTAALLCGALEESSADRADVRLSGGETFNLTPFRVVTRREDDVFHVELRCLKSAASIRNIYLTTTNGQLAAIDSPVQVGNDREWLWRGKFSVVGRVDKAWLSVRYLPVEKIETVPFDLSVGLAFQTPSRNPIARWLRRFL